MTLGASSAAATQGIRAGSTTVAVTITSPRVTAAPVRVPGGTVVFKVSNRASVSQNFTIAGKSTADIPPGGSATLRVALPKSGSYLFLSYGKHHTAPASGVLAVTNTCSAPVSTSVSVQMQEGPMTLSRQTVPCGTVTFVITNGGTMVHTFQVTTPDNTAIIVPGGQGPRLNPGQSASIIVHFTTKGSAFYRCSETEHDEQYGETGSLKLV